MYFHFCLGCFVLVVFVLVSQVLQQKQHCFLIPGVFFVMIIFIIKAIFIAEYCVLNNTIAYFLVSYLPPEDVYVSLGTVVSLSISSLLLSSALPSGCNLVPVNSMCDWFLA